MTLGQSNFIKLLAMVSMLIDHAGLILFPEITLFRIIGRLSFPLLAYQIGVGFSHTGSFKNYFFRLVLFGAAMQVLYIIMGKLLDFDRQPGYLNVFFTLALGLAAVYALRRKKYFLLCSILLLLPLLSIFKVTTDYGLYGIVLILMLDTLRASPLYLALGMAAVNILFVVAGDMGPIQLFSLMAIFPVLKPLSLKWRIPSCAFYLFYPIHLAILYGISMLFQF